jgi:hypothetical protein
MCWSSPREQARRDEIDAELLKKYAFVPERLVTDDLRAYGAACRRQSDFGGLL